MGEGRVVRRACNTKEDKQTFVCDEGHAFVRARVCVCVIWSPIRCFLREHGRNALVVPMYFFVGLYVLGIDEKMEVVRTQFECHFISGRRRYGWNSVCHCIKILADFNRVRFLFALLSTGFKFWKSIF